MPLYLISESQITKGGYTINGLPALVPVLFWLFTTVGFEQFFGTTLRNGISGLKPLNTVKIS